MANGRFYLKNPKSKTDTVIFFWYRSKGINFKYYTLESINPAEWDSENGIPQKINGANSGIYNQLLRYKKAFSYCEKYSKDYDEPLTTAFLRREFDKEFRKINSKKGIVEYFNEWIANPIVLKKLSPETVKRYKSVGNYIRKFQDYRKQEGKVILGLKDLQTLFDEIVLFSQTDKTVNGEYIKASVNETTKGRVKVIKTFVKWLIEKEYVPYFDLSKWKIKDVGEHGADIIYLTKSELEEMIQYDLSKNSRLDRVRDLFVFGCLTGQRFDDYSKVKKSEISSDKAFWKLTQRKTGEKVSIPLTSQAKRILEKHDYRFTKISNEKFNLYLKELCELLEFNEEINVVSYIGTKRQERTNYKHELITSHTARRTYITLSLINGIPPNMVMDISGHKSLKEFEKYIAKANEEHLKESMLRAWE